MSKSYYFTLIFPVLLLFLGASIIGIKQQNLTPETFVPIAVLSVLFIIVQLVSSKFKSKADQYLLSIVIFLSSLSAVMILRLKPDLFTHQLMWISIGLVIFAAVALIYGVAFRIKGAKYNGLLGQYKKNLEIVPHHKMGIKILDKAQLKNLFPDSESLLERIEEPR